MAIILDEENNVVRYENQPEQARAMFPNINDCQSLAARIEILENDIADLKEEILNKTDYIYDTAQGAVASFSDGADDAPIKSLIANINPVQDLNGYDAPWPAGGGKNKNNPNEAQNDKWINSTTGEIENAAGYWVTGFIPVKSGDVVRCQAKGSTRNAWYSSDKSQASYVVYAGSSGTTADAGITAPYDGFIVLTVTGTSIAFGSDFIVTINNENLTFEPYSNICPITGRSRVILTHSGADASEAKTIIVIWESEAGTVYGGTIDVITGVLTVDKVGLVFDGSADEQWRKYGGGSASEYAMSIVLPDFKFVNNTVTVWANYLQSLNNGVTWGNYDAFIAINSGGCVAGIRTITTLNDWLAYLVSNPLEIVYLIATPIIYQLTPIEVRTLLGVNNISANTGNVSVTYPCDLKLYIDNKIAEE